MNRLKPFIFSALLVLGLGPALGQPIQRNAATTNKTADLINWLSVTVGSPTGGVSAVTATNIAAFQAKLATNTIPGAAVSGAVSQATHATNADSAIGGTVTNGLLAASAAGIVSTLGNAAVNQATHATNADNATGGTVTNGLLAASAAGIVSTLGNSPVAQSTHATNADNATSATSATTAGNITAGNKINYVDGVQITNLLPSRIVAGTGITTKTNNSGATTETLEISATGTGGQATNAVAGVETNGTSVGSGLVITNLNLISGANMTITGNVSSGAANIGFAASGIGSGTNTVSAGAGIAVTTNSPNYQVSLDSTATNLMGGLTVSNASGAVYITNGVINATKQIQGGVSGASGGLNAGSGMASPINFNSLTNGTATGTLAYDVNGVIITNPLSPPTLVQNLDANSKSITGAGLITVTTLSVSGNITNGALAGSELVGTDGNKALVGVTVGTGLSLAGGTLSASGTNVTSVTNAISIVQTNGTSAATSVTNLNLLSTATVSVVATNVGGRADVAFNVPANSIGATQLGFTAATNGNPGILTAPLNGGGQDASNFNNFSATGAVSLVSLTIGTATPTNISGLQEAVAGPFLTTSNTAGGAARFSFNASGLTNYQGSNVIGAVSQATYASASLWATNIAASGVSGAIAQATHSTNSDSATTASAVVVGVTNQWKTDATNALVNTAASANAVASGVTNQWKLDATNAVTTAGGIGTAQLAAGVTNAWRLDATNIAASYLPLTGGTVSGTLLVGYFDEPTNVWTANTSFPLGATNQFMTSGAATLGITGILSGPGAGYSRYGEMTVVATGDIVFTNPATFHTSDMVSSRTITNGNVAEIAIKEFYGKSTNMAIVQFK